MADQSRVRNISAQGDLEIPSLGLVVPYRHEAVVDADVAASLIESGHFVAVNRASDTPPGTPPEPSPEPPADAEQSPADASTTDSEEQHQ
ncbi:MAG: hypothetical protein HIU88_10240 [Acidobacteria bacterium]|nr:hypothetical protein [Acidobacteriota bacterium]